MVRINDDPIHRRIRLVILAFAQEVMIAALSAPPYFRDVQHGRWHWAVLVTSPWETPSKSPDFGDTAFEPSVADWISRRALHFLAFAEKLRTVATQDRASNTAPCRKSLEGFRWMLTDGDLMQLWY
jgi:hypothetical protein